MLSLLIVLAIAASVAIGYTTKFNTGLIAICFAYILGCFGLDMTTKALISKWPISIFFVIMAVTLFYNFALVNGTLEKLALHVIYALRGMPRILPFVLFAAATLIAALGAGYYTVLAFMAPITLLLCDKINMSKLVGAVAINCGALVGANFMTSASGMIFRGLMENSGYAEPAFKYSTGIFFSTLCYSIILIAFFLFIPKANRNIGKDMTVSKPEPFDPRQRINLWLIVIMVVVVLVPPVLHLIVPGSATIKFINSRIDVGLVGIIMTVIALFFRLADEKQVVAKVPWGTLIMICGVGMLISVAIEAGTLKILANWIGNKIPAHIVPIAMGLVASFMSFFSSTLGVVCPALFPLVPGLAEAMGINPMLLFICVVVGSQSSAISPFSSGGSLVLGSCSSDEERNKLFPRLIFIAVPVSIVLAVAVNAVITVLLK